MAAIAVAVLMKVLDHKLRFGWRRLLGLCGLAIVLAPATAAGLAALPILFGAVHPWERWGLVRQFASLGAAAGITAAVLMGIIGAIQVMARGRTREQNRDGRAVPPHGGADPARKVE